jgi:hypothetical protein
MDLEITDASEADRSPRVSNDNRLQNAAGIHRKISNAVSALPDAADLAIEQILRGSGCQPSPIRQTRTIHV